MVGMMTRTSLGRYVSERRAARNLRAEDVGARVGKSQSWVSRLETGMQKTFPEPEEIAALADVLQVSPRELLEAAGYLSPDDRDDAANVNPFAVDDPRWALVETIKQYDLTADQAGAVRQVVTLMAKKSQAE